MYSYSADFLQNSKYVIVGKKKKKKKKKKIKTMAVLSLVRDGSAKLKSNTKNYGLTL